LMNILVLRIVLAMQKQGSCDVCLISLITAYLSRPITMSSLFIIESMQ
jgi:hypothetical protein